jgi:hypothetical protein
MRMKTVLLGFAAAGAIVQCPASRAIPTSYGKLLCPGDLCVQRVTSISNGTAHVEAWANTIGFTWHSALSGPDSFIGNSKITYRYAGRTGKLWDIQKGGGYTITA